MSYSDSFALFGLSGATPPDYTTPEQHSKKFERCSILSHDNVSYTPTTTPQKSKEFECLSNNSTMIKK